MHFLRKVACGASVLIGRINVKNLAIVYYPTMFDLEVRGGGKGRGRGKAPNPSLILIVAHPLGTSFSLSPSLLLPLKSKVAAIIFAKEILSTCQNYACSSGYEESCQKFLIVTNA